MNVKTGAGGIGQWEAVYLSMLCVHICTFACVCMERLEVNTRYPSLLLLTCYFEIGSFKVLFRREWLARKSQRYAHLSTLFSTGVMLHRI